MHWRSIGLLSDPGGVLIGLARRLTRTVKGKPAVTAAGQDIEVSCRLSRYSLDGLQELHSRHPDLPHPLMFAAELLYEQEAWEQLLAVTSLLRRRFSWVIDGYALGSHAARKLDRIAEAETIALAAARRFPLLAEGLVQYAVCAEGLDNPAEKARRWARVRRLHPGNRWSWIRGIDLAFERGQQAEADRLMAGMFALFEKDREAWRVYARLAERRHDPQEAARRWLQGLDLLPGAPEFYVGASQALRRAADGPAAAKLIVTASFMFPRDKDVLAERAEIEKLGLDPGPLPPPRD